MVVRIPMVEEPNFEVFANSFDDEAVVVKKVVDVAPPEIYASPATANCAKGDDVPMPTFPPLKIAEYVFCAPPVVKTASPYEFVVDELSIDDAVEDPIRSAYAFEVVALVPEIGGAAMPTVAS